MLRVAAAFIALFVFGSASADAQSRSQRRVLESVDAQVIAPVLRNAGFEVEQSTIADNESIVVRSGDTVVIMRPRVCNPTCTGLLMYSVIEGTAPSNTLNGFNEQTPPTSAFTSDGYTILSRYLIADYGITQGTFLTNVEVFQSSVEKWLGAPRSGDVNALSVSLAEQPKTGVEEDLSAYVGAITRRHELISRDLDDAL
ncbi:MAG: hypothetical protein AAF788_02955 [Pseudomonadota bacterium]